MYRCRRILDSRFSYAFYRCWKTNYYYTSKFAKAVLCAFIWFSLYNKREHVKKLLFSIVFGTWISFYYLISSYSGLVQILGVYARGSPPAFVIFGLILSPLFWWVFHILAFYLGLELSSKIKK